jgi:hypothetical protein
MYCRYTAMATIIIAMLFASNTSAQITSATITQKVLESKQPGTFIVTAPGGGTVGVTQNSPTQAVFTIGQPGAYTILVVAVVNGKSEVVATLVEHVGSGPVEVVPGPPKPPTPTPPPSPSPDAALRPTDLIVITKAETLTSGQGNAITQLSKHYNMQRGPPNFLVGDENNSQHAGYVRLVPVNAKYPYVFAVNVNGGVTKSVAHWELGDGTADDLEKAFLAKVEGLLK